MSAHEAQSEGMGKTEPYEEACRLAYACAGSIFRRGKARRIIRSVWERKLPVNTSNKHSVQAIATLAMSPGVREYEIGAELLEAVVKVDRADYMANSVLFSWSGLQGDVDAVKKHARNLLEADYRGYIKRMGQHGGTARGSRVPLYSPPGGTQEVVQTVTQVYKQIAQIFLVEGQEALGQKALRIVEEIRARSSG